METNYELKHKCLLVPLKVALLVIAMVLVGFTTYAQQGKSVKVATNQQLIEAMENPSIGTVELEPGYYPYLNLQAQEGTRVLKQGDGNGSRGDCTYFIIDLDVCFYPWGGSPNPTWGIGTAQAGTIDCFPDFNCCPGPDEGYWEVISKPATAADPIFLNLPNAQVNPFIVSEPGAYVLRYTWPAFASLVETEYVFFAPPTIDLSAPDVCGLTTDVTFARTISENNSVITWTLNGEPYMGPTVDGVFPLTVLECGYYELCVTIDPPICDPVTECIMIDFSCQPIADAGPDVNVCDELCVFLDGSINWGGVQSPTYAFSWVNVSGPQNQVLAFSPNGGVSEEDVTACRDELACSYGEYVVELQVQNGQCSAEDQATVRFYEQPEANAGPDQHNCNQFVFNLAALPFAYCGTEGVNYWPTRGWEFVSGPTAATILDPTSPTSGVSIDPLSVPCPYGTYVFKWKEENSKGANLGGCYDEDFVSVTIYEDPVPNAGEDMAFCSTFAFSLYGIGDEPCYTATVIEYGWEKTAQPGDCDIFLVGGDGMTPSIYIENCDPNECQYGEYIFTLTQCNGYLDDQDNFVEVCCGSDEVSIWIFEEVVADAGDDQHLCNDFEFNLNATPSVLCGVSGVNYFYEGEWSLVSGPTAVSFSDPADPNAMVTIDPLSVPCPWGEYVFMWTEKNGFFQLGADPEGYCTDYDMVSVFIYEEPEVLAGGDLTFCNTLSFYLDGTVDELCTDWAYLIEWEVVSQPDNCDITFTPGIDPMVTIDNCSTCQFGQYIFKVTQKNGYYDDNQMFVTVCEDSDEVSVWIYEQPEGVYAGIDQLLCFDYTFDLMGTGATYCGDFGVNYNNYYSWTLVSQPADAGCEVIITNGTTLNPSVSVENCAGPCPYGEFVFRLTEYNGMGDVYCEDWDEVSVFIFEQPVADAGDDVQECVLIGDAPYCYDMTAELDYCYSMLGVWTKTCGPGDVVFTDINDPNSEACFDEPGRYKFTWTVWNGAENCEDEDEVIFDLLEQPEASARVTELLAPCDALCIDLGLAEVNKYEYFGTDQGDCPNYQDFAHWELISGPGNVTFTDDMDPETQLCVSTYGGYTVRWNEINRSVDGIFECTDYVDIYVEFNETPEPMAEGGEICGNCFTLDGTLDPSFTATFYWEVLPGGNCPVSLDINVIDPEVCIPDVSECYGTYGFVLHQFNGECEGTDTAWVTFKQLPPPVAICFNNTPNVCGEIPPPPYDPSGCLLPGDVLEVCADGYTEFFLKPECECVPGFDWDDPLLFGWTFEWSMISPNGTSYSSQAGYYDFENGQWIYPWLNAIWGECCDTARVYLTITTDEECELTLEYKVYVHHKPCAEIVGPDVSEVGEITTYCNVCPPDFDMSCLLYTWTAEHCGEIVSGQGTECVEVLWTDYNVNGGWGEITLTVFDTCTGCCNYDAMDVKIWPTGTLGNAVLSGQVYYHNNSMTPLNGVEIQLWNGGIPVMSTTSFNDVEGGGMGYYEFTGVNGVTNFGVTASYGAPWYGANATDALAVELKSINALPPGFILDAVVEEAMDVNASTGISSTDALWIKQRAINMVNYFPAGNWAFDPAMSTQAIVGYDIMALTMGDANRSNIPNSMKSMPAIDLVNDGMMNVVLGEVFELPVRIAEADLFGAMTLNLEYNSSLLEVVDVVAMEGMLDNITKGNVSIAWSNLNPMTLSDNDVVVTLKVKAIGEIASTESLFRIGLGSEFADPSALVVEPVTLKTFGVTTEPAAIDYFLSSNRPNPFSTSTFIEYTMPETGKVRLTVLDMLGQELDVLVEATQSAGSYTVEFSAVGLATGVYIYKITVDGETRDFISTQRMVVSH